MRERGLGTRLIGEWVSAIRILHNCLLIGGEDNFVPKSDWDTVSMHDQVCTHGVSDPNSYNIHKEQGRRQHRTTVNSII